MINPLEVVDKNKDRNWGREVYSFKYSRGTDCELQR